MKMKMFCLASAMLILTTAAQAVDFHITGGGSNKISAILQDATNMTTGGNIIIDDSATYTESSATPLALNLGVATIDNGRQGFSITAAVGATPMIVLDNTGFRTYAASGNVRLGSLSGGRITIDATQCAQDNPGNGNANPFFWYDSAELGMSAAAAASQAVLENLRIMGSTVPGVNAYSEFGIEFGSYTPETAPVTSNAMLTINKCEVSGFGVPAIQQYGPDGYVSTMNITNSQFFNATGSNGLELADAFSGGIDMIMNLDHTIIYTDLPNNNGSDLAVGITGTKGTINIDYCDIVINVPGYTNFGMSVSGPLNVHITNSIFYGTSGGAADFGGDAGPSRDYSYSNEAAGSGLPNQSNIIHEWPCYVALGTNMNDPNNFSVLQTSQSRTAGEGGTILGSRGADIVPVELSIFEID